MQIRSFGEHKLSVGEGPIWDPARQALLAVDIVGQRVVELDTSGDLRLDLNLPEPVFAVARDEDACLLVVMSDGLFTLNELTGQTTRLATFPMPEGTRLNDGKIDPHGRFVVVGADANMREPKGSLFRVEQNGEVSTLANGFTLGNGQCWSPEGTTLYIADSTAKQIYAYEYPEAGPLGERRLFADTDALGGIPDGATIDQQGRLWIALCGAGKVACYQRNGDLSHVVEMPTAWVSSVMFGGAQFERLFVTSLDPSTIGIPGDADCGRLFVVDDLQAVGLPEPRARHIASGKAVSA